MEEDFQDVPVEELESTLDKQMEVAHEFTSIDELNEKALLSALGDEIPENSTLQEEVKEEENTDISIDNLEEELKEKVSTSVKEAINNSSLKEAIKGLKLNITISFEESN